MPPSRPSTRLPPVPPSAPLSPRLPLLLLAALATAVEVPVATRVVSLAQKSRILISAFLFPIVEGPRLTRVRLAFRDRGAGSDRNQARSTDEPARDGPRGGYGARVRGGEWKHIHISALVPLRAFGANSQKNDEY